MIYCNNETLSLAEATYFRRFQNDVVTFSVADEEEEFHIYLNNMTLDDCMLANLNNVHLHLIGCKIRGLEMLKCTAHFDVQSCVFKPLTVNPCRIVDSRIFGHVADSVFQSMVFENTDLRQLFTSTSVFDYCVFRGSQVRPEKWATCKLFAPDLSGVKGLLDGAAWLAEYFDCCDEGYIVYRTASDGHYSKPWKEFPGAVLEEVPLMDPFVECGCGVSFATWDYIQCHWPNDHVWKCLLRWEDLPNVCVPYATDGKARCAKLTLLEVIE